MGELGLEGNEEMASSWEMEWRLVLEVGRVGVGELAVERAVLPVVGEGARETRVLVSYGWNREESEDSAVRRSES